ncbi:hypothetical protein LTR37_018710 [Vermiconidia calcicola]|uniref:Uncharacterized protein n=1 Tax=Vermiconidia calcicola TaxID=1690605 RepID=A0ACC3MGC8_9PEZI|nr:hypothetical protein LTR37_018710 [Vermiconidia calcicola]
MGPMGEQEIPETDVLLISGASRSSNESKTLRSNEYSPPEKKPHPFGTKRNSLERNFYGVVDQPHVEIVDINENPTE